MKPWKPLFKESNFFVIDGEKTTPEEFRRTIEKNKGENYDSIKGFVRKFTNKSFAKMWASKKIYADYKVVEV